MQFSTILMIIHYIVTFLNTHYDVTYQQFKIATDNRR